MTVAALYVATDGCYFGIDDAERSALRSELVLVMLQCLRRGLSEDDLPTGVLLAGILWRDDPFHGDVQSRG